MDQPQRRRGRPYRREVWALRYTTCQIGPGSTLGIIGMNSSGKSTLLRAIAGIVEPTDGRVPVNSRIASLRELLDGQLRPLAADDLNQEIVLSVYVEVYGDVPPCMLGDLVRDKTGTNRIGPKISEENAAIPARKSGETVVVNYRRECLLMHGTDSVTKPRESERDRQGCDLEDARSRIGLLGWRLRQRLRRRRFALFPRGPRREGSSPCQ